MKDCFFFVLSSINLIANKSLYKIDKGAQVCRFNMLAAYPIASLETADSVSIHSINHTGPMLADEEYQLQCDIVNVAPVQNLTVRWYQGDDLLKDQGRWHRSGVVSAAKLSPYKCNQYCFSENSTIIDPQAGKFGCWQQQKERCLVSLKMHYNKMPMINVWTKYYHVI